MFAAFPPPVFTRRAYYGGMILLLLLMAMPLFAHLGGLVIRQWDEARLSVNAWEMMKSGNILVTTYNGEPDLWNTKPPLLIWLQALLLAGGLQPELALRIPSAVAAVFTILMLYVFAARFTQNLWLAFAAALVLLTAPALTANHAARAGDYDATMVFFTTLSALTFWVFLEKGNKKWFLICCLALALGVLTKSVQALLFLPGLAIYALYRRKLLALLWSRTFLMGFVIFLVPVAGFYLSREWAAPGYLNAVVENELLGRYLTVIEFHDQPRWFYYHNLVNERYKPYLLLMLPGFVAGIWSQQQGIRNLTVFATLLTITYFAVITAGKTKLFWYDLPMLPFMALLAALGILAIIQLVTEVLSRFVKPSWPILALPVLVLTLFCYKPYEKAIKRAYKPKDAYWERDTYIMSHYLRNALRGKHDLQDTYVLYEGYNTMMMVYLHQLRDQGVNTEYRYFKTLKPGDKVVTYQPQIKEYLLEHFDAEVVSEYKETTTYQLIEKQ